MLFLPQKYNNFVLCDRRHNVSGQWTLWDRIERRPSEHTFTPGRRQSKTLILSSKVDQKSLETEFLIAISRHTGEK